MKTKFSQISFSTIVIGAVLSSCIAFSACNNNKKVETGAVATGEYHNLFTEVCEIPAEDVQARIDSLWATYFTLGEKTGYDCIYENSLLYQSPSDSLLFVFAVDSQDVRTEGMSYGMIISLMLNHRDVFDKLWAWSKKYMAFDTPEMDGYFCWHCHPDGEKFPEHNASDGEIYFATALFMAAKRWNEPTYEEEAQVLLHKYLDKDPATGIYPLFDLETKLPCFVPNEDVHWFTDPSYALPAFLEIWAHRSNSNQEFWAEAVQANRDFLFNASHPETGLFPDYSLMDGTPYNWPSSGYDNSRFMYDAIRCSMNIGMDSYLYGKDIERQRIMMRRYLKFFKEYEYQYGHFDHDGENPADGICEGAYGANAVGAFTLLGSDNPEDKALLEETVRAFWNQPIPTGLWRYYNGLVYTLCMLHCAGQFKVY